MYVCIHKKNILITRSVQLTGVEAALLKPSENADTKGIKVHFKLDDSGVLLVDKAELVYEEPPSPDEPSTLSKFGM